MHRFIRDSVYNFFKSNLTGSCDMRPIIVTWHATHRCNLRCFFCEECGIERNEKWKQEGELSTGDAIRLLSMLSRRFACIYITGGEPFLRDDAVDIFDEIGRLPFRNVTVNTNLTLMDKVERCLPVIDNLVVSIDATTPERFDEIRGVPGMGKRVLENFERAIRLQKEKKFRLHVNCVVTPSTIDDARSVLHYCTKRGIKVGINAQNDRHGPIKTLTNNNEFRSLVSEMMRVKNKTRLVTGTKMYYDQMFSFVPYKCYPFLTPRINAKGELAWPCDNTGQWVKNILSIGEWNAIVSKAIETYGPVPDCRKSCQFQCYIEPSKMVRKPWMALREYL